VSERSVNDVVELYTFMPAIEPDKFSASAAAVKTGSDTSILKLV
jgi:hypothetical protein